MKDNLNVPVDLSDRGVFIQAWQINIQNIYNMRIQEISQNFDEVDTFESSFKNLIFRNNNLIIPYFNIAVAQHPLNESARFKYLNFSYAVCLGVTFLSTWIDETRQELTIVDGQKDRLVYNLGGDNLDDDSIYNDLRVCCEDAFLQTLEVTKLSDEKWDVNDSRTKTMLSDFWSGKFMPETIKNLINTSE